MTALRWLPAVWAAPVAASDDREIYCNSTKQRPREQSATIFCRLTGYGRTDRSFYSSQRFQIMNSKRIVNASCLARCRFFGPCTMSATTQCMCLLVNMQTACPAGTKRRCGRLLNPFCEMRRNRDWPSACCAGRPPVRLPQSAG